MSEEPAPDAESPAGRLAAKLLTFCDSLPEDEKLIMARIMQAVAQREVEGYGRGDSGAEGSETRNPIDDFRVNLGLYLRPKD